MNKPNRPVERTLVTMKIWSRLLTVVENGQEGISSEEVVDLFRAEKCNVRVTGRVYEVEVVSAVKPGEARIDSGEPLLFDIIKPEDLKALVRQIEKQYAPCLIRVDWRDFSTKDLGIGE